MTSVYISARDELIKMLRARGNREGEIKKQEVYEVIRGIQNSSLIGISDVHPHSDIFVVGCCVFWEDAIRFAFIGKAVISVEEAVDAILRVRVASDMEGLYE